MMLTPAGDAFDKRAQAAGERPGRASLFTEDQERRSVILEDQQVGLTILVDVEGLDGGGNRRHVGERDRLDFAPLRGPKRPGFGRE